MTDTVGAYAVAYLEDVVIGPEIIAYIDRIEDTFTPYGGRWLVHGGTLESLEGEVPGAVVIIGFPSAPAARAWYASPAYQAIVPLRAEHSRSVVVLSERVTDGYRAADTVATLRHAVGTGDSGSEAIA